MAIAAAYGLEAKRLDAVNAFVDSILDEEIYCKCPPGYEHLGTCLSVSNIASYIRPWVGFRKQTNKQTA